MGLGVLCVKVGVNQRKIVILCCRRAVLGGGHIGSVSYPSLKIAKFQFQRILRLAYALYLNDIGKAWVVVYFGRVFGDTSKA